MAVYAQGNLAGDVPVLGPLAIGLNTLGVVPVQVLAADPVRAGVIFHNPGDQNIRLSPANATPVRGGAGYLLYPQNELVIYGDEDLHVNTAWLAVTDAGSAQPITVFNFTSAPNPGQARAPQPLSRLTTSIPIISPSGIPVTTGIASAQVIGANPNRRGIVFQNSSDVDQWVCPANLVAAAGAGSMRILPGQEKRIIAQGRVRVNCAWRAISPGGTNKPMMILEFV